jgi:class 3 adenylate cyclase/ligand-binding sensor domain-containing protein/predicted metal-dependent HD superfamily phosphohydrolase
MKKSIYILIIGLIAFVQPMLSQNVRFENLTIKDGLSQSVVNCIHQDKLGYIWVGTQDGLNRFDGTSFKVYKHIVNNTASLSSSYINDLEFDNKGMMWIATMNGGLNVFNPYRQFFYVYDEIPELKDVAINDLLFYDGYIYVATAKSGLIRINTSDSQQFDVLNSKSNKFPSDKINCIAEVDDKIWIGTEGQGLIIMDPKKLTWTHISTNMGNIGLSDNTINTITKFGNKQIYIGTNDGINVASVKEFVPTFSKLYLKHNKQNIKLSSILAIVPENDSTLWIGSGGDGLFKVSFSNGQTNTEPYLANDYLLKSIGSNIINHIFRDITGSIWVGTQEGVSYFDPVKQGFQTISYQFGSDKGLLDKNVWAINSNDTLIWVGTRQGVTCIDTRYDRYYQYPFKSTNLNEPSNNSVFNITIDAKGTIWTCTSSGLFKLIIQPDFIGYSYEKVPFRTPQSPWDDDICYNIKFYNNIGYVTCKKGLGLINMKDMSYRFYEHNPNDPHSIASEAVRMIHIDKSGQKWVASSGAGLAKMYAVQVGDSTVERFKYYLHDDNDPTSLSSNYCLSIYEEPEGTLWIGTYGGGLNKFDLKTEKFTHYTEENGLANNSIYGITGSNEENVIWMSTNFGLSKFNYLTETFKNYHESDGLQSNEFNNGAYYKSKSGKLFFGGINGFNMFYPEDIQINEFPPQTIITDILVFNRSINQEIETLDNVSYLKTLELNHKQNNLTFKFSAIHFTYPKGNSYKVFLEGVDEEPQFLGSLQQINYSNLKPGIYTFSVWTANSDGIWCEEPAKIDIIIASPFWATWWFISIIVLVVGIMIFVIYILRVKAINSQKERLAFLVEKRTQTITIQKEQIEKQKRELEIEKEKTEKLLYNILPAETAEELKNKGKARTRFYRMVTVMFTDIKGFTQIAETYKPADLVKRLDNMFREIDKIVEKYQLEKIKTIGDAYMAAGGVPLRDKENPVNAVLAALEIQQYIEKEKLRHPEQDPWELRIGLHTGDVIAGVIGTKRIAYDIWGNTVNVAQRMEMASDCGKVNISGATFEYIKPYFDCTYRGKVAAKNKGEIDMYFVDRIKPHLSKAGQGILPNQKFKDYVNLHIYSSINYRKAERHIMKILQAELSPNLHYHGIHHTYDVVEAAERIAIMEGVLDEDIFVLKSAATYHDAGFVEQYDKNEHIGARMAEEILPLYGYTETQVNTVKELIYATIIPHDPKDRLQQIICDADLDYLGRDDFHLIADNLRRELRDHGKINSDRMWDEIQVKFLTAHKYFTKSAIKLRQAKKERHIEEIKERLAENNYKD